MNITKKIIAVLLVLSFALGTFFCFSITSFAGTNRLGDVTSDGSINSFDALLTIRYILGNDTLTKEEIAAADVDGNGKINTLDALYILKFTTGEISKFPASSSSEQRKHIWNNYWYDPSTGQIIDDKGEGLLGFAYDAGDGVFYATNNAWQRNFGYTELYDFAAPFGMINYDTSRVYFDYKDKEYMVQLWKGQYGMVLIGCEIGFYYRDKGDTTFVDQKGRKVYKCASDEMLFKMQLSLYQNNTVLFSRNMQYSWWLTGFVPGSLRYLGLRPEVCQELKIYAKIQCPDSGFLDAFVDGLINTKEILHNATKKTRELKFELNKNLFIDKANNTISFNWQ